MNRHQLKLFIRRRFYGEAHPLLWTKANQKRLDRTTAELDRLLSEMKALTGERK